LAIYEGDVQKELPIYGGSRLGVYNKATGASVYQLTDHLGNVRAVIAKQGSNAVAISKTDYYPFGMPMPNRNIVGDYRYAYQGQEKDIETGKEAFQFRLWDARIGRWLTTDPYGQYSSPYLGMGNNPMNGIDPDGGFFGRLSAWLYKVTNGLLGYDVEKNVHGDWTVGGIDKEGNIDIHFAKNDSPFYIVRGNVWNNKYTRFYTGDKIDLSFSANGGASLGGHLQFEASWLLRGKDASIFPYMTLLPNVGVSGEIGGGGDIALEASRGHFLYKVQELDALTRNRSFCWRNFFHPSRRRYSRNIGCFRSS